jgi:host factor-I protein
LPSAHFALGLPPNLLVQIGINLHFITRGVGVGAAAFHEKQWTTTMAERAQSLQDTFLNHVRRNKTPLTIFLINGVKLQGIVTWFDNFCVLLRRDGHSQLVYKHAISTIMPGQPVHLMDSEQGESQQG